jgi:hypothetical protein
VDDIGSQHLRSGEGQDDRQAVSEKTQPAEHGRDDEEQRSEAEHRHDVRAVDNEWIMADRQHGWDGIERKHDVAGLDDHQRHQQRRGDEAIALAPPEVVSMNHRADRDDASDPGRAHVAGAFDDTALALLGKGEPPGRQQDENREWVDRPYEAGDQRYAAADRDRPEDQRSQDAKPEYASLILFRNVQFRKHNREDEDVVE